MGNYLVLSPFNNSYTYGNNNDTRVLVKKTKLPLVVTYDFGDGTPKKVES